MDKKPEKENFLKNINLKNVKKNSFVKITDSGKKDLNATDRVALNRKGNQFLNEGKIEVAKRIFITPDIRTGLQELAISIIKTIIILKL